MHKISYLTLGCPKNQVDTDSLIYKISGEGFGLTDEPREADALIVNTCCFIDDAKKESIDVILQVAGQRKRGSKLIVMGCMGQRYRNELIREIPEIDAVFGVEDFDKIVEFVRSELKPGDSEISNFPGIGSSYGYIKVADGCTRTCSFCIIPAIRGRFRSDRQDLILNRSREFLKRATKEIILVAQDITGYGKDLTGDIDLSGLIGKIADIRGDFWIRLLYLHPAGINEKLIDMIAKNDKICNYFDVPVQHSEDDILGSMRRGHTKDDIKRKIERIRNTVPDAVLRTALIVGYPGETDRHFKGLKRFVMEMEFERLGVFKYSPQEGTMAHSFEGQVPDEVKNERYDEIMSLQSAISFKKNKELVGKQFRALIDDVDDNMGIGRLYSHAPEIDGAVMIHECPVENKGKFTDVRITEAYDYDIAGDVTDG